MSFLKSRLVKTGSLLLPVSQIDKADYSQIEDLVLIVTHNGVESKIEGIDALETAMLLNPSCLEGKRLRWARHAWLIHNLVGHPLMQMLSLVGLKRLAFYVHDITVPRPFGGRKHVRNAS